MKLKMEESKSKTARTPQNEEELFSKEVSLKDLKNHYREEIRKKREPNLYPSFEV